MKCSFVTSLHAIFFEPYQMFQGRARVASRYALNSIALCLLRTVLMPVARQAVSGSERLCQSCRAYSSAKLPSATQPIRTKLPELAALTDSPTRLTVSLTTHLLQSMISADHFLTATSVQVDALFLARAASLPDIYQHTVLPISFPIIFSALFPNSETTISRPATP